MKYKITLYLIILLLSSCTILERAGIEKRRYRPGYYLNSASSQSNTHRQIHENIADEKTNRSRKTVNILADRSPDKDITAISSQESSVKTAPDKAKSKVKPVIEKIQSARPSHNLFHGRSALCAVKKSSECKHWGDGCGNGCGNIFAEIAIVILAVIILILFPGINPQTAELLAVGILIVAAIIVFILMANH